MEEIRTFLDAEDVVTARWLAMNLSIKMSKAYPLLKQYLGNVNKVGDSSVKAFYLLSGSRHDGTAVMLVVSEDVLEVRKEGLRDVSSCEIYSLQRDNRSNALPGMQAGSVLQLYYADSNHEYTLLSGAKPGVEAMLANKVGRVQPGNQAPRIVIKPAGERIVYSGYTAPRAAAAAGPASTTDAKHATAAAPAQEEPLKASKESTVSAGSFFSSSAAPLASAAASASGTKAKSALFGGGKAAAPAAAAAAKPAPPAKQAPSPTKSRDEEKQKAAVADEGSDAEWDDGTNTGASYKPNKENLKKRKVALGMPDGTGGLHQADVEKPDDDDDMNVDDLAHHRSSSPQRSSIRGAIDDWRDDAADATEGPPKKRTKIKTVEKMLMDDRGYMITTLVEEEVTDDEDPAAARAALQAKQQRMMNDQATASTEKPKPKAAAAKKAAPTGQKGMMSFFGKS